MKKLSNISFDSKYIYAEDESGTILKQSLLWYPALMNATEEQRNNYVIGFTGWHWKELDEDISFESFEYDDAVPSVIQEFFLVHREINIAEFSKRIGINPTLLRNYINGFKKPSRQREIEIMDAVYKLGMEYCQFAVSKDCTGFLHMENQCLSENEMPPYKDTEK